MKQFLRISPLVAFLLLLGFSSKAQLANPAYEIEYTVHNGSYGGVDLTGYVTYEVYIRFTTEDSYLLSVFGEEDPNTDCVFDTDTVTNFNFPCGLFQYNTETQFGFQNNCLNGLGLPGFESEPFDSYMTIGYECSAEVSCDVPFNAGFCPEWVDAFEGPLNADLFDGGSFFWDGFAMFVTPAYDPSCSVSRAGSDFRVKIAQFTSCGGWNGCVSVQFKTPAQVGTNQSTLVTDICMDVPHPCLDFPLDTQPVVTNPACFGDQSIVDIDDGGFGTVNYTLYSGTTIGTGTIVETSLNDDDGWAVTGLAEGSYYYIMEESTGCRDTSVVFTIDEPDPLIFGASLLQGVECFGETTGQIEVTCSGGTGTVQVLFNNTGGNACGDIIDNLPCGTYLIQAEDENGCGAVENIEIACPVEFIYEFDASNVTCFGADDAVISGNAVGGTGEITINLSLGGTVVASQSGVALVVFSFENLDNGEYELEFTDENGCGGIELITITEPVEVNVTANPVDASCFSLCDGSVTFDITGGTGPFVETVFASNGNPVPNVNGLCAGNFTYTVIDANDCEFEGSFSIAQPTDITFSTNAVATSCAAQCDGQIEITNVQGSFGGYTYSITPSAGVCLAPCSGSSATFADLCAGVYSIIIEDQNGCSKTTPNLSITSPAPVVITLTPEDVSCFGLGNGSVIISGNGGTGQLSFVTTGAPLPTIVQNLTPGTYTYTITDSNGCQASDDVIIGEPSLLVSTLTSTSDVTCGGDCDGQVLYGVIGGTTPYNYILLPGGSLTSSTGVIGNLCASNYDLVLVDGNGCTDTLNFQIEQPTPLDIVFNVDAPTCTGMTDGSAVITVSGGTGDLLAVFGASVSASIVNNGNDTYSILNLGELTIEVELLDQSGCIIEEEFEVVPDIITDMILTTFSSPETCWNEQDGTATVGVQNGNLPISYLWDDPLEQTTPTAIGLTSNLDYSVRVTDDIGCTLTTSVFVEPTIGCFVITNALTPNGDGVNDTWILGGLEFFPNATVQVFNRWGQLMFESIGYAAPWDGTFQGQLLPVADYYFVIEYANDKEPITGTVTIKY